MKRMLFFALSGWLIASLGCKKDSISADDTLVQEIAFSTQKVEIPPAELPATMLEYIDENHFETYIETAYMVPDRGYEAILGDESLVYCDRHGRVLRPHRDRFRRGPCGHGEAIGVDELPANIVTYVEENYPDATILRAKQMDNGNYILKISEPRYILIFSADGSFIEATVLFYHCRPLGVPMDIANLPEAITEYVSENYPGSEILVAFHKHNGLFVLGVLTTEGRKIMVFDADGNLLFVRP